MKHDFSGKVVLVTGGTGAVGRALASAFDSSNATTVVTYLHDKQIQDVKAQIGGKSETVKADITVEAQVKELISKIMQKYARIDVLVNVVGGYLGGKSLVKIEEKEWDLMMNINLKSAFLISKHVLPIMLSAQHGKIVHIASRTGLKSDGYDSAYGASKAGLIRLVESISGEVREANINVNCILPSTIDTEANRKAMPSADFTKWIKTTEIADVVLFLCSEESRVINGAAIPTYGLL